MDILENAIADYMNQFHLTEIGAPIVCLCGSTRFKSEFEHVNRELTLLGNIVLAPGVFGHSGAVISDAQKESLDMLHFEKVAIADWVCVVDVDGYIGESTTREIKLARTMGKPIYYISKGWETR